MTNLKFCRYKFDLNSRFGRGHMLIIENLRTIGKHKEENVK
jgi:hypothetical protein